VGAPVLGDSSYAGAAAAGEDRAYLHAAAIRIRLPSFRKSTAKAPDGAGARAGAGAGTEAGGESGVTTSTSKVPDGTGAGAGAVVESGRRDGRADGAEAGAEPRVRSTGGGRVIQVVCMPSEAGCTSRWFRATYQA